MGAAVGVEVEVLIEFWGGSGGGGGSGGSCGSWAKAGAGVWLGAGAAFWGGVFGDSVYVGYT